MMLNLTFGERIRFLRLELKKQDKKKYSLQNVANRIGVTKQSLSLIERQKIKNPSFAVLNRLAADLGVTVDYLLTGISGNKESFIQARQSLTSILKECNKTLQNFREHVGPVHYQACEKIANILELLEVVQTCLAQDVYEDYDRYTQTVIELTSFVELIMRIILKLDGDKDYGPIIDRFFWDLGRVFRQIAVQIDRDNGLRNLYSDELGQITSTIVNLTSIAETQEFNVKQKTVELLVKDLSIRISYRDIEEIPEEFMDEFKKRVFLEWEFMLARVKKYKLR
ncbi:transcriptional regulator, XRE family [Desulfofarcimen acetoxidans DSM 771]|uniref:Transcriptional regulator, XRE family n=2 Tax=Desulfofarcimen acetoxidans TaxID=58138 RepID=C8W3I5_DESAS|nr:transcriptional regulator, XRE family [Desulfofarcimen acetoxidans DSM 771]